LRVGREIAELVLPEEVTIQRYHMITAMHELAAQWNADIATCPSNQNAFHNLIQSVRWIINERRNRTTRTAPRSGPDRMKCDA
jgi:hypothetical protein